MRVAALAWRTISLPLLAALIVMLPAVQTVLWLLAFLGIVAACFFRFFTVIDVPFWGLLSCSVGCGVLLMGYHRLIRFLT